MKKIKALFNFKAAAQSTRNVMSDIVGDPAVLMGIGDTAAAGATTGATSVSTMLNGGGTLVAIGSRAYSSITGKASSGLGWAAAAGVSVFTAGEIIHKGLEKIGSSGMISGQGLRDVILPATAFGAWAVGNGIAGWRERINRAATNISGNAQTYFCAGSAAIALAACIPAAGVTTAGLAAGAVSLGIFSSALAIALRGEKPADEPIDTGADFLAKHVTNKRLRALGHSFSGLLKANAAAANPSLSGALLVAAYGFFAAGCVAFDKEKNANFITDIKKAKASFPVPADIMVITTP